MRNLILIAGLSLMGFVSQAAETEKAFQPPRSPAQVSNALTDTLAKIEANYQTCINNPKNQNTNGNIQCAATKEKASDTELNKLYKEFMAKTDLNFSKESKKRLKASQRAWIIYRDTNCSLQGASNEGGSLERMIIAGCSASTTHERVTELNNILNDSY